MELFQLRYFVAAARALHFSRAAEQLYVSQPSLSLQISKLETELGTPLFHRQGRRVSLTDAGRTLLPLAERILDQEAEARLAVQQVAGLERGRLSLCALPALDQRLLPPWLARYRRDYPGIEIRVWEERPARAVAQAVLDGQADLGFIQLPCDTAGLEVRILLEDPILLVVPAGHPFADRESVPLSEAAGEDWVWVHEAQDPDHPLYAACLRAGFAPRIVCESGSAQGVLALVAAGLGVALLPQLAVEKWPGAVTVALAEGTHRSLAAVWVEQTLSHAARAFLEMVGGGAEGVTAGT